jgi:hypothetical protein
VRKGRVTTDGLDEEREMNKDMQDLQDKEQSGLFSSDPVHPAHPCSIS